jgi:hypothetical protein
MPTRPDYAKIVAELEGLAEMLRNRPDLNHGAADRLSAIIAEIKRDAALERDSRADGEDDGSAQP